MGVKNISQSGVICFLLIGTMFMMMCVIEEIHASKRKHLAFFATRKLMENISNPAMEADRIPCNHEAPQNCRPGDQNRPYSRGCSKIDLCRDGTSK